MLKTLSFLLVAGLVIFVIVTVLRAAGGVGRGKRYAAQPLLTPNEVEFFHRLKRALPGMEILAQVAMGALMVPAVPRSSRDYLRIRGTFAQKYVDFVICHPRTMEVMALVELDDVTHVAAKDSKRDAMLREAGYRVVRWQSKSKPTEMEIARAILQPVQVAA